MIKIIILAFLLLSVTGCPPGYKVEGFGPITVHTVKREDAALTVLVRNKSRYQLKLEYPTATGYFGFNQDIVFSLPKPGNYKVVVMAFARDLRYGEPVYSPVATTEIPVFLNGYDYVTVDDKFVGSYVAVTDGMFLRK